MHPHHHRPALRYLWLVLLIAALVILFPISARSQLELVSLIAAL
jgi:hypothetical protein